MRLALPALLRSAVVICVAALAAACGADQIDGLDDGSDPPDKAKACGTGGANLTTLKLFEGVTVRGADLPCLRLSGSAEYILAPQLLGADLPYAYQHFEIGAPDAAIAAQLVDASSRSLVATEAVETTQQRLHRLLRAREMSLRRADDVAAGVRASRITAPTDARLAVIDARRNFSVLSSLSDPPHFATVSAALRFSGAHVLVYVDDRVATTYTDTELDLLGKLFDEQLYGVDHAAFGQESDIDGNGRIVVLFTPTVNALVSAADCPTMGFATGFFYGFDLASTTPQSNRGEIFYAMVPDQGGAFSCPHTKADVASLLPVTFVHEFQHMISYGHHVVSQGGEPEALWLNEGLSHMAEELGALYFESRYPPPAGRSQPNQLFPDSAEAFITGDLVNSYRFLRFSEQYSVTTCAPGGFCDTEQRGGAWLFLRWLADATSDPHLFDKLEHSGLQGTRNIEAAAGRSFGDLFGDFTLAVWGDSLVGSPRASTSALQRFASRNLRQLYAALYEAYGPLQGIPQRFPITPIELTAGARVKGAMRPGSYQAFRFRTASDRAEYQLGFTGDNGVPFSASQGAQLSILRVPPR
jgi:hypothetical protein